MSTTQMSFAEKMRTTSTEKKAEIEAIVAEKVAERAAKLQERAAEVRDELFTKLTLKYHDTIKRGINNAARNGKSEKYINFARDDFKANCHGVGFPQQVQFDWLKEMCNPESKYLPLAEEANEWWAEGEKMHFQGVEFNVWNNKAFTVVFKW
jgi:hypothetical protein